MSSRSERPKNRKIKLVGGGVRWSRVPNGTKGGTMKAKRRLQRKLEKMKKKQRR